MNITPLISLKNTNFVGYSKNSVEYLMKFSDYTQIFKSI